MQAPKDPPDPGPKLPGWAARAIFGRDSVTSDCGALTLGEVPEGHFDGPPNEPMGSPKPQMLGQPMSDTGYMKRYGKLPPRRMPEDPEALYRQEYEGKFPAMQMLISTQYLSEVLHELAGQASMCWTQPPKGVFDSDRCLSAVSEALKRLEAVQPVAQCGQCGRKTWDDSRVCGMPQPDGSKCAGLMQPV